MTRRFGTGAVALLLVAPLATAGAVLSAPTSAAAAAPHLVSGTLTDASGTPVPDAHITVSVENRVTEPFAGDLVTPIAETVTDDAGRFSVTGGLGDVPATVNHDGTVNLEIYAVADQAAKYFNVMAAPPRGVGRPDWTWGPAADTNLLPSGATGAGNTPMVGLTLSLGVFDTPTTDPNAISPADYETPLVHEVDQLDPVNNPVEPDVDLADALDETLLAANDALATDTKLTTSGHQCQYRIWSDRDVTRKRYVQTQKIKVMDRTKQTYNWLTTEATQLQIAYSFEGKLKGKVPYAGGLTYARTQDKNTQVTLSRNQPITAGAAMQFRYQKQAKICIEVHDGGYTVHHHDTGERRWVPLHFAGPHYWDEHSSTFKCNPEYRGRIEGTLGVRYGTSVYWDGWFEIADVALDGRQTATEATSLSIRPKSGYQYARICGYKTDPTQSNLIREVPY